MVQVSSGNLTLRTSHFLQHALQFVSNLRFPRENHYPNRPPTGGCLGSALGVRGNGALEYYSDAITVVAFEGKYLICEDCKTRNGEQNVRLLPVSTESAGSRQRQRLFSEDLLTFFTHSKPKQGSLETRVRFPNVLVLSKALRVPQSS